ncbi:hypothetical protein [Symmachiella dynata]|uniref:hypothetical protein n=1 Tax=Symmachiella dynata TaxID=2527995 RepID=UPI0011A7D555|nr:hypothetical protein [Symmachiella dynata]
MRVSKGFLYVGGGAAILATILALAIKGTIFGANFVGLTALNANPSFIVDRDGYLASVVTDSDDCSNTGCTVHNPFDEDAADRGLQTGSSSNILMLVTMIANPTGYAADCWIGPSNEGSGGYITLAEDLTATGTTVLTMSGTIVNPTHDFNCNFPAGVNTGVNMDIKGLSTYLPLAN